ncbi:hypothetical protein GCM10009844_28950 [Nocardioides koreensis]|uniref:Anti-sigma K factor RskA C-terminal domain-containing protein n=1 Tax=Nocardioides koreensis TaxID=433651 RepID=A0ABN2ZX42_9ACTN
MSAHPDLLALLRGELSNPLAAEAGDHLDGCPGCRTELAELATANAMLSRSARTLAARPPTVEAVPALPPRPPFRARQRRALGLPRALGSPRALGLLAAAATVVAIAGATTFVTRGPGDPGQPPGPQPQVSAPLDPVEGAAGGRVLMTTGPAGSTEMTITTSDLPRAHRGEFYEAWLLDPASRKMLPLGQLGPSGRASFEIDDRLLDRYSAVDVSLEADDGDPQHSVTSVLRASYDAQRPTTS